MPGLQRCGQRRFIHQRAARGINIGAARLHRRQESAIHHAARFFIARAMGGDDIGFRQAFMQNLHRAEASALDGVLRDIGVMHQHLHPEGSAKPRDAPTDAAKADDQHLPPGKIPGFQRRLGTPIQRAQVLVIV